jgi:hypothetical protein
LLLLSEFFNNPEAARECCHSAREYVNSFETGERHLCQPGQLRNTHAEFTGFLSAERISICLPLRILAGNQFVCRRVIVRCRSKRKQGGGITDPA